MDSLLTEIQISKTSQVSLACLRRWRLVGDAPRYVEVGPLVKYRPADVERKRTLGQNSARKSPVNNNENRLSRAMLLNRILGVQKDDSDVTGALQ